MEVVRSASSNKATGLGAVAGGFPPTLGLVFACEVIALVLLARSFSRGHAIRTVVSVLSLSVSALMLLIFVGSAWLLFHLTH